METFTEEERQLIKVQKDQRLLDQRAKAAEGAQAAMEAMIKNPPSRQALNQFFFDRAGDFLQQHPQFKTWTRAEKRKAAREIAKRYGKQVRKEIETNAHV